MSSLIRLLEHDLRQAGQVGNIPVGTRVLVAMLEHQFALRDQSDANLQRQIDKLREREE